MCRWLCGIAIRRRDPALLHAAIRLRATHTANDAEREAFTRAGEDVGGASGSLDRNTPTFLKTASRDELAPTVAHDLVEPAPGGVQDAR